MGLPYYRFFPGDYLRDTRRLTLLQHGAYRILIDEYMSAGGLRGDLVAMNRICGALSGEECAAVEFVLAEFFVRQGPAWRQARCDKELEHMASRTDSARDSALKRWQCERNANAMRTQYVGNASQSQSQSQSQKPEPLPEPEDSKPPKVKTSTGGSAKKPRTTPAPSVETWTAYAQAYFERYGTEPVRNARANGQLAAMVARLGATEAPLIAAYYLTHDARRYVERKHSVGLLLMDCEGLRTEWATNRQVTETQAHQGDKTAATGAVFKKLIDEARNGR